MNCFAFNFSMNLLIKDGILIPTRVSQTVRDALGGLGLVKWLSRVFFLVEKNGEKKKTNIHHPKFNMTKIIHLLGAQIGLYGTLRYGLQLVVNHYIEYLSIINMVHNRLFNSWRRSNELSLKHVYREANQCANLLVKNTTLSEDGAPIC